MNFDSNPIRREKGGEYNDYILKSVKCMVVMVFTIREVAINIFRLAIGTCILYLLEERTIRCERIVRVTRR